jgi:Ni/Co efflux regulator RcnB
MRIAVNRVGQTQYATQLAFHSPDQPVRVAFSGCCHKGHVEAAAALGQDQESKMRKLIITALMAAMAFPAMASAQSRQEIRRDRQDLRQEQRQLDRAYRTGDRREIRDERNDVRQARRELREDSRDFRQDRRAGNRGGYAYRGGAYRGPQGYRYRPVNVGHRFAPNYYGRNYWVNDYSRYQLTRPRFGYQRWVRYGRDVVLVDTRSGRVIQVRNRHFR